MTSARVVLVDLVRVVQEGLLPEEDQGGVGMWGGEDLPTRPISSTELSIMGAREGGLYVLS